MATTNANITLDAELGFTYGETRLADTDPLEITAQSGVTVNIQLTAPMKFEASHDDKGRTITWDAVSSDAGFTRSASFPCPRNPFTLKVSSMGATATGTTSKTKKVRIEAGASGTAKSRNVNAPAGQGGKPHTK